MNSLSDRPVLVRTLDSLSIKLNVRLTQFDKHLAILTKMLIDLFSFDADNLLHKWLVFVGWTANGNSVIYDTAK